MPGAPVGPTGKRDEGGSVKGKTGPLAVTPMPGASGIEYFKGDGISFELQDAPAVCVPTSLNKISYEEMQVLAWLRQYSSLIIAAEAEFHVDRRAIAAAIAWEALKNVHSVSARAVGPGKPHVWTSASAWVVLISPGAWAASVTDEGTWAKSVEDAKLLPKQTYSDRKKLLQTPAGAIQYIAAIMDLIASIYEDNGSPGTCNPSIRENLVILTNEYQGSDREKWTARMKTIKKGEVLTGPKSDPDTKSMAVWIANPRNVQFVEDAVGPSSVVIPQQTEQDAGACDKGFRDANKSESLQVLLQAKTYEGTPYSYGGNSKMGIDCSHHVWHAITEAIPGAKFDYMNTSGLSSVPWLRKLDKGEFPVAGDVMLFEKVHHVGFYDDNPKTADYTLYSARGDQNNPEPGVTEGKPEWWKDTPIFLRVRVPCK